jgi:hypothetical protein
MKKHAVRVFAIFICLLIFSASFVYCGTVKGEATAYGNVTQYGVDFSESIESPIAGETINGTSVSLHFLLKDTGEPWFIRTVSYIVYLDGVRCSQSQQTINGRKVGLLDENLVLTNVTQGEHTILVDTEISYNFYSFIGLLFIGDDSKNASVNFFVYQGIQPQVSISGLDMRTNQTRFSVITNELDSTIYYSLDGAANVTLPQNESAPCQGTYKTYNITLFGLSDGSHSLVVYAKDAFNQTAVAEEAFVLPLIPLSTVAAVAGCAAVLACAVGLLLYKKKTKASNRG